MPENKEAKKKLEILYEGTPLGLCDSSGLEFKVASIVRRNSEINFEMHGSWVEYKLTLQGTTPIMSYFRSEKGQVLPIGYTACCLSDIYDMEMFVFSKNSLTLRPEENIIIVS